MTDKLFALADEGYKSFNSSLIPNLPAERFIGVRTPQLRALAKKADPSFLRELPHKFFEEDQIHGFIISDIKDFRSCICELQVFLPYIDNWATCDQTSPKCFAPHKEELLPYIETWLASSHSYTVRFAINMLMRHFLSHALQEHFLQWVADIKSEDYYVNMGRAWYFATALATNWDDSLPYVTEHRLDRWTHNMTVRKATESRRIGQEQKELLKKYRL